MKRDLAGVVGQIADFANRLVLGCHSQRLFQSKFMKLKIAFLLVLLLLLSSCGGKKSATINDDTAECSIGYPEQTISPYVLPYMPNAEFVVGQGNCTDGSHEFHTDQAYAYDFDMLIGTNVVASRGGTVTVVVEDFWENNNTPGHENYLIIQHGDGTIAGYYHLTADGIHVAVGDLISQGDIVGQSGNTSDSSEPHLHFEVAHCEDCETLPVNFKNTREHKNGLTEGEVYKAE
jgi:hypothetical protein